MSFFYVTLNATHASYLPPLPKSSQEDPSYQPGRLLVFTTQI